MPAYEIYPHGFLMSNYDVTNEKDDKRDSYEVVQDGWSFWSGYRANMAIFNKNDDDDSSSSTNSNTADHQVSLKEQIGWNALWAPTTFDLYDHNDVHHATVRRYTEGGCCEPDYFEVKRTTRLDRERGSDDESGSSSVKTDGDGDDTPAWMMVHEDYDDDDWLVSSEPHFIFRHLKSPAHKRKRHPQKNEEESLVQRVAKLTTDCSALWSPKHRLHIKRNIADKDQRQTIMAVGIIIVELTERKRRRQQQQQQHHHAAAAAGG